MTSIPEMLSQLFAEYTSAEDKIKSCERYTLASPMVAVNQMRYAGCHILEYLKCDDKDGNLAKRYESIAKAMNHCKRASFDALETLIFAQLEFIADFQSLCRTKRDVQSVYPDYVSDYSSLAALQERLQSFKMVQALTVDEVKELESISSRVSALKRKILKKKILVDRLDSVEVADGTVLSVQQFLLSFTATVLGTVLGIVGVFLGSGAF